MSSDPEIDTNLQPPLFILSMERSGSTLLRYLLDTHPLVGAPGELALAALGAHMLTVLRRLALPSCSQDDEPLREETRQIISGIMRRYLARVGKRIWCDKSPINMTHLRTLQEIFPDARCICLYRACRDTAYSCYSSAPELGVPVPGVRRYAARHPGNLPRAMTEYWCDRTAALLEFERGPTSNTLRMRYEDLVTAPDVELTRVMRWLELEWDPSFTARALTTPHSPGGGDFKIHYESAVHTRSVGRGRHMRLDGVPAELLHRANTLLAELGYSLLPTHG